MAGGLTPIVTPWLLFSEDSVDADLVEVWKTVWDDGSELNTLVFDDDAPRDSLEETINGKSGYTTFDPDTTGDFIIPEWSESVSLDNTDSTYEQYEKTNIADYIPASRRVMYQRENAVEVPDEQTQQELGIPDSVTPYVYLPDRIPTEFSATPDTVLTLRFPDDSTYRFTVDQDAVLSGHSIKYPFRYGDSSQFSGIHPTPRDGETDFEWPPENPEYHPFEGPNRTRYGGVGYGRSAYAEKVPAFVHWGNDAASANRFLAEFKSITTNQLKAGVQPTQFLENVERATDKITLKAMNLIGQAAMPSIPLQTPLAATAWQAYSLNDHYDKMETAQDSFIGATGEWDRATSILRDTSKTHGQSSSWIFALAPENIGGEFGINVASPEGRWPTLFDLAQLFYIEQLVHSRIHQHGGTSQDIRQQYVSLLQEQTATIEKLLSQLDEWHDPAPYAGGDEKEYLEELYNWVYETLEVLQSLAQQQITHVETLTVLPEASIRHPEDFEELDPVGDVPSEEPGHPPDEPDEGSSIIDGSEFTIRQRDIHEITISYKESGEMVYETDRFEVEIEGSNADGRYSLTRFLNSSTFEPGDTARMNQETLGIDEPLDFSYGTIILAYEMNNGDIVNPLKVEYKDE